MPKGNKKKSSYQLVWIIKITIITFFIAYVFSIASDVLVRNFNILLSLITILIIIFIGVIFDTIGIAVATASDIPFYSMASKRIKGANKAIYLLKNADQVSNLCNDVVGDICGIISGSAGGVLVLRIQMTGFTLNNAFLSIIISSLIAALTVGGKAFGKTFAMTHSQRIVFTVGLLLTLFDTGRQKKHKALNKNRKR